MSVSEIEAKLHLQKMGIFTDDFKPSQPLEKIEMTI